MTRRFLPYSLKNNNNGVVNHLYVSFFQNYDQNEANLTYANLEASQMQSQNLDVPEDHYEEDEEDPDDEVIRAAQAVDPAPRRPQQAAAPSSPMSYYEAEQPCTRRKILGVYEKKPKVKKEEKPDGRKKKCPVCFSIRGKNG